MLGDNDEDMALAAQTLVRCGGGEVAVQDGKVLGLVELPVCGLMSDQHVEKVANQVAHMEEVWKAMGCTMPSPFMTLSGLHPRAAPYRPRLRGLRALLPGAAGSGRVRALRKHCANAGACCETCSQQAPSFKGAAFKEAAFVFSLPRRTGVL